MTLNFPARSGLHGDLWAVPRTAAPLPPLDPERISCGEGQVRVGGDHLSVVFPAGGGVSSYQLRYAVPDRPVSNGYGMRIRLRGWRSISYIAIGHTDGTLYRHVKATNPRLGHWFDFDVGFNDLAWGWRNGWETPADTPVGDVRLYIKGEAEDGAACDLAEVRIWREAAVPHDIFGADQFIQPQVLAALSQYQRAYFPDYARQAQAFMDDGRCPLAGNALLDWGPFQPAPPDLCANGTWQYSWHSLHPAVLLMLLAEDRGTAAPLMAARDIVTDWLARSYENPKESTKYTWYDHGVAERVLAMIMLYGVGQAQGFDVRIMARLRLALYRHGQLLASEVFYAGHQPTRYHNHAWFQDLALLSLGLAFPGWTCSDGWIDLALERINDQFGQLIIADGDFAVFAENSIGYHMGVERLVQNIATFARMSGRETAIPSLASGLATFTALMRYPDGKRTMAQGDTFRLGNPPEGDPRGRQPYPRPHAVVLPVAGYGIAKANHGQLPFMLVFLGTSRAATHKHCDNLSVTLYADGVEWLTDPSFCSHEYKNPVPAWLRGPVAHNALVLPERPYSILPDLAEVSGQVTDTGFLFEGSHRAVEGAVFHRRVTGRLDQLQIDVSDRLEVLDPQIDPAEARLMFHCGEGVEAEVGQGLIRLTHPGATLALEIALAQDCAVRLIRGQDTEPVGGVAGQGFLQVVPVTMIEVALPPGQVGMDWALRAIDTL